MTNTSEVQWSKLESMIAGRQLVDSFSGGRTSAVMTKLLADRYGVDNLTITFANTGCEDLDTLEFVHECETKFNWPVVWLEAVVYSTPGVGIRHKIVDYETAARNGEPFEQVVAKYGIFNQTSPACTARLKTDVMNSYLSSIGLIRGSQLNYCTAIGIRVDESDRVSSNWRANGWVYPLCVLGYTKRDVALEIATWGFDLRIKNDAYGNCVWCWKKTMRKHLTLAKDDPHNFDFPKRMEEKYGTVNGNTAAAKDGRRYWFRKHLSVSDILEQAENTKFVPYEDDYYDHAKDFDPDLDVGGSCGDSCEIGADE